MAVSRVGIIADSYNLTPLAPNQITGLRLWYDADDLASITNAGAGHVSQWNDKSGNATHLTQATDANRPITGTRTLNGRNVLDFTTAPLFMTTSAITMPQPFTQVVVAQYDKPDANQRNMTQAPSSPAINLMTQSTWRMSAGTVLVGANNDTSPHVFIASFNGATSTLHLDGVLNASGDVGAGAYTATIQRIGYSTTANAWDGAIAEVAVYNRALTQIEARSLWSHLRTKWGTP